MVLLAVLLWQSLSTFGSAAIAQRAGELDHLVAHCHDNGHHHNHNDEDEDQSLHMDDSVLQHLHADSGSGNAAVLVSAQPAPTARRSMSVHEASRKLWLSALSDRLLRPPQHVA